MALTLEQIKKLRKKEAETLDSFLRNPLNDSSTTRVDGVENKMEEV